MKRLCFELVDFDGDIVSTVEETDPFTVTEKNYGQQMSLFDVWRVSRTADGRFVRVPSRRIGNLRFLLIATPQKRSRRTRLTKRGPVRTNQYSQ
jgi:hypothetical protein